MSWVASLFNTSPSHLTSPDDQGGALYVDLKHHGNNDVAIIRGMGKEEHAEPMDEEEEAARAPYWHVSLRARRTMILEWSWYLTQLAVYVSRWYWRDIGGLVDALD